MIVHSVSIRGVSLYQLNLATGEGAPAGQLRIATVTLSWTSDRGFGEVMIKERGSRYEIDAEGLSADDIKAILGKMVDTAVLK